MPKRILLADDSITIQKVVELTFSDGDYEVTAVNNGAKAIAKLAEMRPDVILSDIIMPEKNGYEVCEYVKSHPEYRTIPVVLLTGTFEPFDPDRADKAGCDAVVTKPFESQSLIHKVDELIQQAQSGAAAAPPAVPEPAPEPAASPFNESAPAYGGETRAFPSMSFEELEKMTAQSAPPPPPAPPAAESLPWEEQTPAFGGETRAFPSFSLDEPQQGAPEPPPPPPAHEPESPFGEESPAYAGETRAFTKMSFEDLQQMAAAPAPEPEPEPQRADSSL